MLNTDFLVIGAGIIGLTIARELQRRYPDNTVTIIEKETGPGQHASGRNSGVLHSGIYYTADSLKARFTRDGNLAWQQYCEERNLPLDRCGKLVIARDQADLPGLEILQGRGRRNGVEVHRIDPAEVRAIEPRANAALPALFIPATATVDPGRLVAAQQDDFTAAGGRLLLASAYRRHLGNNTVATTTGKISAGTVINCAGLYADRVAQDFGFGRHYAILPFKGLYLYADPQIPRAARPYLPGAGLER